MDATELTKDDLSRQMDRLNIKPIANDTNDMEVQSVSEVAPVRDMKLKRAVTEVLKATPKCPRLLIFIKPWD